MGAAAAVLIKREKDIVEHFRRLGAIDPETAQTADAIDTDRGTAWRLLVSDAVIRPAGDGKFYLDEPSWAALRRRRRRMVFVVLALAFVILALGMFATSAVRR